MKRLIVVTLSHACTLFDSIPTIYRHEGKWHIGRGAYGCYVLKLSSRSADLDERWNTGVWQ